MPAKAFAPTPFATPIVNPDTASLFRRTPYISATEYQQAPTAVAVNNLVPNGSAGEQAAALAAVISRASDWLDTICFHTADGTLAASPSTESGWIKPRENGWLRLICNYKPILEVDALAIGRGPNNMENLSQEEANGITIEGPIINVPGCVGGSFGPSTVFPPRPTSSGGRLYVVWVYVNGYPHSSLAAEAKSGASEITVEPSAPGGAVMSGVYEGTQLTIHDGEHTEVILVSEVNGLKLKLASPLQYTHTIPAKPDTVRVSAVPWIIEQACISLTSCLIKMRGARSLVLPSTPGGQPNKQAMAQAGGLQDYETAAGMLHPFVIPVRRSR